MDRLIAQNGGEDAGCHPILLLLKSVHLQTLGTSEVGSYSTVVYQGFIFFQKPWLLQAG